MEYKTEMVPLKKMNDAFSLVNLNDVLETLSNKLTRDELATYARACMKVMTREKLSRCDAMLFNKIDEITMREHGMCLKDSAVTKARLIACKRFGIKFIDRDNLINHMNMFLG